MWIPESRQVILCCSEKLWDYLQNIKNKGIENLDLLSIVKVYKEIKSLDVKLEQENKENAKS